MAGEPQGLFHFPGISQIVSGSFTLAHGTNPSVASLTIAPQPDWPAAMGTLSILFGSTTIQFPNCKVDRATVTRNGSGQVCNLSILDRRWMWAQGWGWISGRYNVRKSDGSIKAGTEKTPQQLAKLCLESMGEDGYDVSPLPNDTQPAIEWDFDTPAEALARLCDDLGCSIVLGLDNKVKVVRTGIGRTLDTSYVLDVGVTANPPEKPDKVAVVCSHVRFQMDLELEAVAKETAGTDKYVLLNDVSYKPAGGFKYGSLPYLPEVTENSRSHAEASVLKAYRVKVPFDLPDVGDKRVPKKIETHDQFELLDEKMVVVDQGGPNEFTESVPSSIKGVYFPNRVDIKNNVQKLQPDFVADAIVQREFQTIIEKDTEAKIVLFHEAIYRNALHDVGHDAPAKVEIAPATLRLQASIIVKLKDTRAPVRYVREKDTGSNFGTPTLYLQHEEIIAGIVAKYQANYAINGFSDNRKSADKEADYYIAAALAEFGFEAAQSVAYPGVVVIEPDGAIRQVTWNVGGSGATTSAHRNTERVFKTIPYKEMRRLQRQEADRRKAIQNANDPKLKAVKNA